MLKTQYDTESNLNFLYSINLNSEIRTIFNLHAPVLLLNLLVLSPIKFTSAPRYQRNLHPPTFFRIDFFFKRYYIYNQHSLILTTYIFLTTPTTSYNPIIS